MCVCVCCVCVCVCVCERERERERKRDVASEILAAVVMCLSDDDFCYYMTKIPVCVLHYFAVGSITARDLVYIGLRDVDEAER